MTAVVILLTAIFLISTATSCNIPAQAPSPTSTQPPSPAPQTTTAPQTSTAPRKNITAIMDDDNSLIFYIQGSVSGPGKVIVQYWSQDTGPFITAATPTQGTSFSVEITRLRASTQYNFQVFLIGSSNAPISQYQGTFKTGPLPQALQSARIQLQGTPTYDLLLLDFNCTNFNGIVAVDSADQIVWYYQNDNSVFTFAQENNHNLVFNELAQVIGYTMKEIAPDGRTIHLIDDILQNGSLSAPLGRWNHEMLVEPNGKILTLGAEIRAVNINGKDTLQSGGTIEEWDMVKGTVIRLVSLFDLLDPVKDRGPDSDTTQGFF
jgi:hypothetical protein